MFMMMGSSLAKQGEYKVQKKKKQFVLDSEDLVIKDQMKDIILKKLKKKKKISLAIDWLSVNGLSFTKQITKPKQKEIVQEIKENPLAKLKQELG